MELQNRISCQRISHIIDSYQLLGSTPDQAVLERFRQIILPHRQVILEMAIANCLVIAWAKFPLPRGQGFLDLLEDYLSKKQPNQLTPRQFQQITGLKLTTLAPDAHQEVRIE